MAITLPPDASTLSAPIAATLRTNYPGCSPAHVLGVGGADNPLARPRSPTMTITVVPINLPPVITVHLASDTGWAAFSAQPWARYR